MSDSSTATTSAVQDPQASGTKGDQGQDPQSQDDTVQNPLAQIQQTEEKAEKDILAAQKKKMLSSV